MRNRRRRFGETLQVSGALAVFIGAAMVATWLGLVLGGVAAVLVGYLIERQTDGTG